MWKYYILNKTIEKNGGNKKFENYLSTIEKSRESALNTNNQLLPNFDLEETINIDFNETNNNNLGDYRAPSIDSINSNKSKKRKTGHYSDKNVGTINNSLSTSSKGGGLMFSKNYNLKVINCDNFQLYNIKIKKDKTITKNNKFERIKNKYICTRKNKVLYEIEIDSMSESASNSHEYYSQLVVEHKINLSYFPLEEYFTNETLIYSDNNLNSNKIKLKMIPEGYKQLININIALFILLFLLIFGIVIFDKILLNHFGVFIIKVWIIPTIIFYIIIYPISYYLKNLFGSILLFKYYHLKNRGALYSKILFGVFVNKTMIYIFKVRNYITKYEKELDY